MLGAAGAAAAAGQAPGAHEVLRWGRELLDPALRDAVDGLPTAVRRIAGYHIGWWDADGAPADEAGGKALRPTLCLLTAAATSGGAAVALPGAVALELVHDFSLLHDDVMDGDALRRHRATAWAVFGTGPAILAGDAMLAAAFGTLASSGNPHAQPAVQMLVTAVLELVDGQSLDLEFERREDITLAQCRQMAQAKTGALIGCACALGATLGAAHPRQIAELRSFGERLGFAFQLADDLLGIWSDRKRTGKTERSDLTRRKRSLPVVAALRSQTPAGAELRRLYGGEDPLSENDVRRAATLVERAGGRAWCEAQIDRELARATKHLRAAHIDAAVAAQLDELTSFAGSRVG